MFFPSATVVAAMVLSFAGTTSYATPTTAAPARGTVEASAQLMAALWAPKKKSKARPLKTDPSLDGEAHEEELLRSPNAPAPRGSSAPASRRRKPIIMDEGEDGEE